MDVLGSLKESVSNQCFKDIESLVEQYINELKDHTKRTASEMTYKIGVAQDEAAKTAEGKDREYSKDQAAKRMHQSNVIWNKYENQVIARKKAEEADKRKSVDTPEKK